MPAKSSSGQCRSWTTLAELRRLSLAAWEGGQLLRESLVPTGAYPRRRALKRPSAAELRDDYPAARAWAAELFATAGPYSLETVDVGRTTIGSNQLPALAVFATVEDEVAFAGKSRDLGRYRELADALSRIDPTLRSWALKRPLQLLALSEAALTAARVALWLRDNPAPGIYVRQLSLPGVHTKFLETHRRIIDEMVAVLQEDEPSDELLEVTAGPADAVLAKAAARTSAARFAERHGFLHPPELVRFRLLDPTIPLLGNARDVMVSAAAFSSLQLPVSTVIVTENLVNFLALPDQPLTFALFGAGYGFTALRDAKWLQDCEVFYWGDLDTHGFRILDQLRAIHPHVSSILMDEETLLAHRSAWGSEDTPSRAELARLTADESSVYAALVEDKHGPSVRLEQELIRWDWALGRILSR